MQDRTSTDKSCWNVSRPTVRLLLTLFFGLLGALLMPLSDPNGLQLESIFPFIVFCLIFLVILAGASLAQLRSWREIFSLSCLESLLRGVSIALTAPLLLFASRPIAKKDEALLQFLPRMFFAVIPHLFALCISLPIALSVFGFRTIAADLGMKCLSFSVWAWIGCGLLFVLGPWPDYPRSSNLPISKNRKIFSLAAIASVVLLVLMQILLGEGFFLLLFIYPPFIGGTGYVLLLFLIT